MQTFKVTTPYIEVEVENITNNGVKTRMSRLFFTCKCLKKVLKPDMTAFRVKIGTQKYCECGRLIWTMGKKVTWSEYVSGKPSEEKS